MTMVFWKRAICYDILFTSQKGYFIVTHFIKGLFVSSSSVHFYMGLALIYINEVNRRRFNGKGTFTT
ncbi:Uncharacterised protein [Lederbergia lenta]|uniref:Uncharacterized protein n=1 Tax=Lederbergia lenta TaxID=1467 RepID=A0A2X4WE56_LEDLE|nr:Uncharacterised protein [Lederbergia lenta]